MSQTRMHDYTILDVFTDVPLEGNPVAVFDDGSGLSSEEMQRTARELNLSETVFLLPAEGAADGADGADAAVRIFTPGVELPFAGHPVLGTAFLVGQRTGAEIVRLQTGAGVVPLALTRDGDRITYGEMEQPVPRVEPYQDAEALLDALRVPGSELPVEVYTNGPRHVYVALADEAAVGAVRPDMAALSHLPLGVSCFAGAGSAFKTRMFAPGMGVPEDPATGSAAGPLALHLARHGRIPFGAEIEIRQGAEIGRPSFIRARVEGSAERVERVLVGGSAVVVARGQYRLR